MVTAWFYKLIRQYLQAFVDRANALLEAEEAKCERVYGSIFTERDSMGHLHYWHSEKGDPDHTHTALLWNVEKIGEGEK